MVESYLYWYCLWVEPSELIAPKLIMMWLLLIHSKVFDVFDVSLLKSLKGISSTHGKEERDYQYIAKTWKGLTVNNMLKDVYCLTYSFQLISTWLSDRMAD